MVASSAPADSPTLAPPLSPRALALPVTAFTLGTATVAFLAGGRVGAGDLAVVVLASCLAWPVSAAVLLDRRPGHRLGAVLCVPAVLPLLGAVLAERRGSSRPLPSEALTGDALPAALLACVALVAMPLLTAATVHRLPAPTWTAALPAVLAGVALVAVAVATAERRGAGAPGVPGAPVGALQALGVCALSLAAVGAHVVLARTWRRCSGADRDRLGWYLIGVAVLGPAAVGLGAGVAGGAPAVVTYVLAAVLAAAPAAVTALLLSPAPPALDLALGRAAAFTAVVVALAAVYVGAVGGLAATGLPQGPVGAAVLTGTAALIAVPLWTRVRSWAEALVFGAGRRPETVLASMRRGVADARPAAALAAVTDWVAETVRSPAARVQRPPCGPGPGAAAGGVVVPLCVGGLPVGWLEIAPRASGERYGRRDLLLLEQLAVPVALVLQAVAAGEALARSEQRVTDERARERRRVLDDLHDGLGPSLAGIGLHLAAARGRLAGRADDDPRAAEGLDLLDDAIAAVSQARTSMRRLVHDLGDDLGDDPAAADGHRSLGAALAELVGGWSAASRDSGLAVELPRCELPDPLPAEVGTAAYRIVGEAVTNVVRHAGASRCTVEVFPAPDPAGRPALVVRVADDGCGRAGVATAGPGVGLRSMHARARELGGCLEVRSTPAEGTVLTARLPLGTP